MKSFAKPMPSNTNISGSGDHVGDHNKLVDALNEIRAGVPNQASEVNAAPNTILSSGGKVLDSSLASAFVKTINGFGPDSNGNVVVTVSGGYDGSDAVKTSGAQTISGAKTFTTAPLSSADAVNAGELVRLSQLNLKANATATVNISGDQTIAGVKTFSSPPVSSVAATSSTQLVRKNELDLKADATALAGKADTSAVVTLANAQTITGTKTFTSLPVAAGTASADSQLINFGQVKSLIPGLGTPSTLLAAQDFSGVANGTVPDYENNVIPNGNATGASVTVQNNALKFVTPTAAGNVNRKFWYGDSVPDADITATFSWDGSGTNGQIWFVYRSTGNSIDRGSGTMFFLNVSGNQIDAGRSINGSYTAYASYGGPKSYTFVANTTYKVRALLVGQRVRYKVWVSSAAEPANWNVDLVDPTSFAGAPADFGVQAGSSTQTVFYVDDLVWNTPATGTTYVQTINGIVPDGTGNVVVTAPLRLANPVSTAYTLASSDHGKVVEVNSSTAVVVTLPNDNTDPMPVGTVIIVAKFGTGSITITPASGVTLNGTSTVSTQYAQVTMRKRGTNLWVSN